MLGCIQGTGAKSEKSYNINCRLFLYIFCRRIMHISKCYGFNYYSESLVYILTWVFELANEKCDLEMGGEKDIIFTFYLTDDLIMKMPLKYIS